MMNPAATTPRPDTRGVPSRRRTRVRTTLVALTALVTALSTALPTAPATAQTPKFGFYLAPPFVQTPYYAATIQNFNEAFTAPSTSETVTTAQTWSGISEDDGVTGSWQRKKGDQFGGATRLVPTNPGDAQDDPTEGNRSEYAAAGLIDIRLAAPVSCLGFWWSAGDGNNGVTVYTDGGTTRVATLTTAGLTTLLGTETSPNTVTAISGAPYNADAQYFGHPVGEQNPRDFKVQPYAYVHAIASGGVTFDRIVLRDGNHPSPPSFGFEFDNFAVATTCPLDPSLVVIDEGLLDPAFEQVFLANLETGTRSAPPARPVVTCSPDPVAPNGVVTCEVTSGPVDHEILWSASIDGTFVSAGVMLDREGSGTFTFRSPPNSSGRTITVELVSWNTSTTVSVSTLVPTRVPAGEGPRSTPWVLGAGLVALMMLRLRDRAVRAVS